MKLNAFFVKPKGTDVNPGKVSVEPSQNPILHPALPSTSLLSVPSGAVTNSVPPSPQKNIVKNAQSDYDRYFLPFNLPAHTILAPKNSFMQDPDKMQAARTRLDRLIAQEEVATGPISLQHLKSALPSSGRRGIKTSSVIQVVECVNGSPDQPIDLTDDTTASRTRPLDMLEQIPMKYIHFGEDVRPPYYGTYTRSYTEVEAAKLARKPISRLRQDTNYDYDSEAEWEEPEEGEDLDSEGDDDLEEEAEDDMEGFLDDEEDPQVKRRLISGDLQPISTGLCWQDGHGVSRLNDGSDAICTDFREFSIGFLLQPQPHAIDPFSAAYWNPEPVAPTLAANKDFASGAMNPPRAPLAQRTMNGLLNTLNTPQQASNGTASKPTKAKRMIPPEQLPAFKAEIDGKDLTKIGMVEALKKVFPKLPKDAITNTLGIVAARIGPTEKEKRWVLINT
jgi:chromatin assembly factor 1 subunit A